MPRDGTVVPLFGAGLRGYSPVVSSQRRSNLYVEFPKDQEKGSIALYPRPGLTYVNNGGASSPCRGVFESFPFETAFDGIQDYGVAVNGSSVSLVRADIGVLGVISTVLTDSGPVGCAFNPTQFIVVDGRTGYVFNKATLTKTTLEGLGGASGFPAGATSVCFLAGRFVANEPGTGKFWYSDLNDGTVWGGADFYTAETDPDDLRAVWSDHGELHLFGQYTTEFWAPGSGSTTFARVGGAALEWGLAAVQSLRKTDNGTLFVGQNRLGDLKVVRLQGYSAVPISTPEIETELQSVNIGAGVAMTFAANGHTFYVLSFPSLTMVYDATSGTWDYFTTGQHQGRWIGQYGALIGGSYFVTDYRNNRLYKLDENSLTDGGETIVREVITRHTAADYDRTSVYQLGVDFETGVGLVSGQGSDPQAMLQVSRDNGRTWGNEMWRPLGALGAYARRVWWGPLGRARDWLFRIRVSDPVRVVIAGGSLKVGP